jgi:hypothetical protein
MTGVTGTLIGVRVFNQGPWNRWFSGFPIRGHNSWVTSTSSVGRHGSNFMTFDNQPERWPLPLPGVYIIPNQKTHC